MLRAPKFQVTCIGNKGLGFMQRAGAKLFRTSRAWRYAAPGKADRPGQGQLDAYMKGEIDALYIALHPLHQHDEAGAGFRAAAAAVRRCRWVRQDQVGLCLRAGCQGGHRRSAVRYVEALIYQAVAENMASEQSARMVAMKSASDNAKNRDRRIEAGLQQGPSGRDYQRTFGNRQRRCRGLTRRF
jgi:F-type H+-transporting ATPase subunit gamma